MSSSASSSFKLALVQLFVTANKQANLANARRLVLQAAGNGANVVVLPECFNSPYGTQFFAEYAETANGETAKALSSMAKDAGVVLVGGSFPELADGPAAGATAGKRFFNTCTVWGRAGELLATHRKVHLFDIDVPGRITFQESKILSPGSQLTHVDTEYGRLGVGICYDIRFPELAMIAARRGCVAMLYPGAFNMTTGPLHWELLQRARALDNQMYVAACSPARDDTASYVAWGHSSVVDPMGQVIATTAEAEDIVYATVDTAKIAETRQSIPVYSQRRFDLYPDRSLLLAATSPARASTAAAAAATSTITAATVAAAAVVSVAAVAVSAGSVAARLGLPRAFSSAAHTASGASSPNRTPLRPKRPSSGMGRTAALIGGSLFVGAGLWTVFGPTLLAAISPKQVDEKQHLHSGRPRQELPAVKRLLSDDQVHRILTAKQATLDPADGRTPAPAAPAVLGKLPAVRIDVNSVASNSPIEDYHSQVVVDSGLLVGVFDGHGGPECGKIVSKFLLPYVAKAIKDAAPPKESGPERHKAIKTAIRTAFETLDNDIVNGAFTVAGDGSVVKTDATFATWALGLPGFNRTHVLDSLRTAAAGSCAVVAYLDGDDVYVACTGDCRAVLGRRVDYNSGGAGVSYIATPLSTDQTAKNPSEYARIQEEHPGEDVIIRGRVLGGLMPTRAFGDARYKWPAFAQQFIIPHLYEDGRRGMPRNYRTPPYVTAMPEVIHYRRDTNDSFLVLATDGLWDAVTNDLCVEVVGQQIRPPVAKQELLSNANAATALVRSALSDGDLVPDPERVRHILSIPPRKSRHYRDDITVNVVFFDSVANAVATPSAVAAAAGSTAKSIDTVNLALASPKKHYLSSWVQYLRRLPPPEMRSKM
ncbi:hypothetical protein HK105_208734 [Polyrhizophydium stewartii]|uniref:Uncharacterized protein n=1 Tax=Polyrhizophydium stewartii TaxID=2732419 RepID=A0ABR4MX05_9FUNG